VAPVSLWIFREHARRTPYRIAQQQKEIEALTATVKEQAAQIPKVSAQLELSKTVRQTVLNS
jgi:hypothetical protein